MRFRRIAPFIIMLLTTAIAACGGGSDPTPTGCFDTVGGRLVEAPCDENGGPTPTPTATTPITTEPPITIEPPDGPGPQLFLASGCAACHAIDSLPGAAGAIGPNLTPIGAKGEAYIRESIVDPNAVIAEECPTDPCQPGLMPQTFGQSLSQEELDALVAYLLTLR